jgi:cell division protease FtsH
MTLGGRVAEDVFFGKISTGAQNDLEKITKMAYAMVTIYGMNEKVGHVSFRDDTGEYGLMGKPYSENTSQMIDEEVRKLIDEAYTRTKNLIIEHKEHLENLAQALLSKEILFQQDLEGLIGKRPFDTKTTYQEYMDTPDKKVEEEPTETEPKTEDTAEVSAEESTVEPPTETQEENPVV